MKPVRGHALDRLRHYLYHQHGHVTVAQCQCGEQSPEGLTVAERRQWHRNHKASVLVRRTTGIEANQ